MILSTPEQLRNQRLHNDLKSLESIRSQSIHWVASDTSSTKFLITFNIRSIVGLENGVPQFSDKHVVEVQIPANYPLESPIAKMAKGYKPPFHPNFFSSGSICTQSNNWMPVESLAVFVIRLARMFQFDPAITNPESAANSAAADWYRLNKGSGLFPTDTALLPIWADDDENDFVIL